MAVIWRKSKGKLKQFVLICLILINCIALFCISSVILMKIEFEDSYQQLWTSSVYYSWDWTLIIILLIPFLDYSVQLDLRRLNGSKYHINNIVRSYQKKISYIVNELPKKEEHSVNVDMITQLVLWIKNNLKSCVINEAFINLVRLNELLLWIVRFLEKRLSNEVVDSCQGRM